MDEAGRQEAREQRKKAKEEAKKKAQEEQERAEARAGGYEREWLAWKKAEDTFYAAMEAMREARMILLRKAHEAAERQPEHAT